MKFREFKNDGIKLMVSTLVVLVLVMGFTLASFLEVHRSTEERCYSELQSATETVDWQISEILNNTFHSLHNLSDLLTQYSGMDTDTVMRLFKTNHIGNMELEEHLYLPDGKLITEHGCWDQFDGVKNYNHLLRKFDKDDRYISSARKDSVHPEKDILELYYPVRKEDKIVAIISAVVEPSVLRQHLKKIAYNGHSNIVIIDRRDGTYIIDTDHEDLLNVNYYRDRFDEDGNSISPKLDQMMDGQEVMFTIKSKRSGSIIYNFTVPSKAYEPWSTSVSAKKNVIFETDFFIRNILLMITIGELLVFIIYFMFLLRWSRREDKQHIKESLTFTNFFLNTYVSAYYVNLDDLSYQIYKRTPELEKNYPIDDNYYDSLVKYIHNEVHPEDRENLLAVCRPQKMKEILSKQSEYSHVFRVIEGDVEKTYKMQVIRGLGKGQAAFGFFDITKEVFEQKTLAVEAQKAREAAEAANKAKTNFLFNMSHDIRTPMNAITGFTNMAIKHIDDKEKVLDSLEKTQSAGNMLLSLINSVLEVSRIEAGHITFDPRPVDIYQCFENIKNTLKELALTKDIDLTFEFKNIRDRFVYADISHGTGIFVNIISNSIKYTQEGGYVKVTCEQIEDTKEGYGNYKYTFKDNGIGMSSEFQKHIFEQFAREETATSSGIQGTGLGMAIVKSYVDNMGGSVSVESEKGKGSVFTVIVPLKIQTGELVTNPLTGTIAEYSDEDHSIDVDLFAGKIVLLVEDNELNREIAIDILNEAGFVVEDTDDGTKAVDILKQKGPDHFDFILMDIQMPVMNGYEATKEIRRMYPDAHIPIIALSANAFSEDKIASLNAGMDGHVAKPIDVKELFAVLSELLK